MRALILGTVLAALAASPAFAEFTLASPDVKSGSPMALAQVLNTQGCTGQNISPALTWAGEPQGTRSFAVTMVDTDAQNGSGWWHWIVLDIPAGVHGLPAGAGSEPSTGLPAGARQGNTSFGFAHYGGPCPPAGVHAHHYEITVYALKVPALPIEAAGPGPALASQLASDALATAKIVGRYGR